MHEKLQQLITLLPDISDLGYTTALLGWDQQTYMPPGGAEARGNQLALLGRLVHGRATSPELVQKVTGSKIDPVPSMGYLTINTARSITCRTSETLQGSVSCLRV